MYAQQERVVKTMKRILMIILAAMLFAFIQCGSVAEDFFIPGSEQEKVLRETGRETENVLATDVYRNGDAPEVSVFLMRAGDTAQLTVLEAAEDGKWHITAWNDTIPVSVITSASLYLLDSSFSTGRDRIRLEMQKYIPAEAPGGPDHFQAWRSLEFDRSSDGSWVLYRACDIPFEDVEEGRCPYHVLSFIDDGWVYQLYEEIIDAAGWPVDRSDLILQKSIPAEEMAPYTELSQFAYPEFLEYLHSLAPAEYEHAPYYSDYSMPSPEPVKTADGDGSASGYEIAGIAVPENVQDEAHRCSGVGPISEGYTWIVVADDDAGDMWEEGEWYIIDVYGKRLDVGSVEISINYYSDGLLSVWKGNKAGCIDTGGNEVIPFEYDKVRQFHHGIAIAKSDGKYGLINRNNEILLPLEWDDITEYPLPDGRGNLYQIERDGKYGFAGMDGQILIPCSLTCVQSSFDISWPLLVQDEVGIGYVDQTGNMVIPCIWPEAGSFKDGLALVYTGEEFGCIDSSGELLFTVPEDWQVIGSFHEGLALISDAGSRYGWIDASGALAIPFKNWECAGDFSDGRAAVTRNERAGFIDRVGNEVITCEWDKVMPFYGGYAPVMKDGEWVVIDAGGNIAARIGNVSIYRNEKHGLYEITDRTGKHGLMHPDGKFVTECQWDGVLVYPDGVICVDLSGKIGFLNCDGEIVAPCVYDDGNYGDGYFTLIRDGYLTILDQDGLVVF